VLNKPHSQVLLSKPKCCLEALVTGEMGLQLTDSDAMLISMGMLMIFPSLDRFCGGSPAWAQLGMMMKVLGQSSGFRAMAENFVRCLNEMRESVENGIFPRSPDEMTRIICEPLTQAQGVDRLDGDTIKDSVECG